MDMSEKLNNIDLMLETFEKLINEIITKKL